MDTKPFARGLCRIALALTMTPVAAALAQDAAVGDPPAATTGTAGGLNPDMKLDDLVKQDVVIPAMTQVVNTVNRTESTVGRSPAAVFVITQDMIKRSGVRSIPEALRMAPGIEVAKINASTWAITARGFQGRFANKLLVQIDRRVVYTPTFGGVYWDVQDVVLADVERIEVIRGPGTTAWGSNAVNGVINIITKKSSDTQGALIQSGGGTQERDFNTARYGGRASEDLTWRAYGQQFDRNSGWSSSGVDDAWRQQRGGFRMDWTPSKDDTVTFQGDIYNGYDGDRFSNTIPVPPFGVTVNDQVHVAGGNTLFRWSRDIDEDTGWQFQSYYDRTQRNLSAWAENRDTYDVDFQYRFSPAEFHKFVTGANYRRSQDFEQGGFSLMLIPQNFATQWASVFVQDTMTLEEDRLYFTLGTRLEQNTFGNFQVEPTARLLYLPSKRESAWIAVSRAVRKPTRFDTDIHLRTRGPFLGSFYSFQGNPDFQAENLIAYEIGYRAQTTDDFSWDIAAYANDYHKLEGLGTPGALQFVPPIPIVLIPVPLANNIRSVSYGVELTATWQLRERWRLFGSYSVFENHAIGSDSFFIDVYNLNSPHNQVYLRSSWDLANNVQLDLIGRYVDRITGLNVPNYIEMDTRMAWRASKHLEFSLVGQNLLHNHHLEYKDNELGLVSTEVRRGYYGMMSWTY